MVTLFFSLFLFGIYTLFLSFRFRNPDRLICPDFQSHNPSFYCIYRLILAYMPNFHKKFLNLAFVLPLFRSKKTRKKEFLLLLNLYWKIFLWIFSNSSLTSIPNNFVNSKISFHCGVSWYNQNGIRRVVLL